MILKRLFDIVGATFGLLILAPLLVFIIILIKIKMPDGPVFFIQKRVGKNAKLFNLYKFRTMITSHSGSTISISGEERITNLGVILRKYKLDELPALWNVLRGEMSLVGPRPDVPGYADLLSGEDRKILKLKPGITGPASLKYANEEELLSNQMDPIKFNNEILYPDKVKINLDYFYNRTFFGDIKIIFRTIFRKN